MTLIKYFAFLLLENEVQWTNSSNVSSPSRKLRLYPGGNFPFKKFVQFHGIFVTYTIHNSIFLILLGLNANSAYADSSPSLEDNRKNILRQNDLNLIDRTSSTGGVVDIVQTTTNNTNQHHPTVIQRDPYASEEFVVEAEGKRDSILQYQCWRRPDAFPSPNPEPKLLKKKCEMFVLPKIISFSTVGYRVRRCKVRLLHLYCVNSR